MNAKTASRRLVPLSDTAIAWLAPHRKAEGDVAYFSEENKFCGALVADVAAAREEEVLRAEENGEMALANELRRRKPFVWKRNGLRHSFCSYRLALTHDAAKVALEAGNSPTMVFRHYRELVTEDEANAWFSVGPVEESNVLPMPAEAAVL